AAAAEAARNSRREAKDFMGDVFQAAVYDGNNAGGGLGTGLTSQKSAPE
ncbi:MAG: hypothetical protein RL215_3481, partial [Planctomycetota bacterium]